LFARGRGYGLIDSGNEKRVWDAVSDRASHKVSSPSYEEGAVALSGKGKQRPRVRLNGQFIFGRASIVHLKSTVARSLIANGLVLLCAASASTQKASQDANILPKYDVHTEMKAKGTVDEINILPLGTKKNLRELVIKSGEDKVHIFVCPQTFEEEMGISFTKGDEITVTGSKVKQEELDVILAREMVKGTDMLVFRDAKGNPVWDPRTGK
jgi:hypothetical protein